MKEIAFVVGIAAVIFYFLGYLQKARNRIIVLNITSRVLYILQYILLSAYEGAVLDVAGIISSFLAKKKDIPVIQRHIKFCFVGVNVLIIAMGLLLYQNLFSLLPIVGVLFHTSAFWLRDEKRIRQVSFLGSPFWLIYNFVSGAYGSCIGDILSMISIGIAMLRYDVGMKNQSKLMQKRRDADCIRKR